MIGLYRPEAIGMLVTAERRQQRGTERDEEDCEESASCPMQFGSVESLTLQKSGCKEGRESYLASLNLAFVRST